MPEDVPVPELPAGRGRRPRWDALGESERQARLVAAWAAARPGTPFPAALGRCAVCRPLGAWWLDTDPRPLAAGVDAEAYPALAAAMRRSDRERFARWAPASPARRLDALAILEAHQELHTLLLRELTAWWADAAGAPPFDFERTWRPQRALYGRDEHDALLAEPALAPILEPVWDAAGGRAVLRGPVAVAGRPERSKAFLVLHRHRFGAFVGATVGEGGDDAPGRRRESGAAPGSLRLADAAGRVLELAGLTAGYEGEGPRGTLWALRAAGLPDGTRGPDGRAARTDLERTVFGERAFRWPPHRASGGGRREAIRERRAP